MISHHILHVDGKQETNIPSFNIYSLGDSYSHVSQLIKYLLACLSLIRVRRLANCPDRLPPLCGNMKNRIQRCTEVFYKLQ